MKIKKLIVVLLCLSILMTGCSDSETNNSSEHEAITFMSPYLDCDAFIDEVHKTYPEVNIEIIPYSGHNTTTYLQNKLEANDLPDICIQTVFSTGNSNVSETMIDLSGYDFTDNYFESMLKDVTEDDGAIYMLPSAFTCFGITYNKTLLQKHGWDLPNSFSDLEKLAEQTKEVGVQLCQAQIQYPGYGFQYLCNIADTGFLSTLEGKRWQKDYLQGKATASDCEGFMESMAYIQKWKDIGMFDMTGVDPYDDENTRRDFMNGNTLFLLGMLNGISETDGTNDEFATIPYLSEDGKQNVYILYVKRYYGLNKKLEENPKKLEDALKVMKVLSTVEGTNSLYDVSSRQSQMLPFKNANVDNSYYSDAADFINAGNTAPFIYSGWENTLVNTGIKMIDFIQDRASIEDVVKQLDDDQDSVVNNTPEVYTTVVEEISSENCAKLIGRCFAEATNSDVGLISLGTWISGNGNDQNKEGLSGKLYAKNMTDSDICTILPTGWSGKIKTVQMTGRQLKDLSEAGYDRFGNGKTYPYVLATKQVIDDEKTYQIAICGISETDASKYLIAESDVVGMDAAKDFFKGFDTLSEKDAEWE